MSLYYNLPLKYLNCFKILHMPKLSFLLLLSFFTINLLAQKTVAIAPNKQTVLYSVSKHQEELIKLSDQVWAFAEIAMKDKEI